MNNSASAYNLAVVRTLLTAAFGAEDLRRFCQGHPLFQPILANLGLNYNLQQMADEVIDYCQTHLLWDELLAAVEEDNPRQYARFADHLRISASPTYAPPSPSIPSEPVPKQEKPPRESAPATPPPALGTNTSSFKRFLSKPIVWFAIAALIVVGGYFLFVYDPPPPIEKVALKTAYGRYVTALGADANWQLVAETDVIDPYEKFTLLCQDSGEIALQTWHETEEGKHRYVTAMGADWDWVLRAETDVLLDYEKFTLLNADTGQRLSCLEVIKSLKRDGEAWVAFQTWHKKEGKNRLVTAMDADWDWVLRAETNELKANERFTMILLP